MANNRNRAGFAQSAKSAQDCTFVPTLRISFSSQEFIFALPNQKIAESEFPVQSHLDYQLSPWAAPIRQTNNYYVLNMRFHHAVLLAALAIAPVCAERIKVSDERGIADSTLSALAATHTARLQVGWYIIFMASEGGGGEVVE